MKNIFILLTLVASISALPAAPKPQQAAATTTNINPAQVPQFGQVAGIKDPKQAGSCIATSGVAIPCQCPPDRNAFIAKLGQFVSAGKAPNGTPVSFPADNSVASQKARINAAVVTLQNFDGLPGKGCPAASAPGFAAASKAIA